MSSFISNLKIILSEKKLSIAIIALAIVARIVQLMFFYNIRVDGMYQVMAMENFVDGHGITTSKVLPAGLSTIIYEPLINWPPGYSLLLSPFYILSGHNYIAAGITLDILAAIVLIFTCRRILKNLETPVYLVNIFTLLTGFFIYYFYFINSSDAVAITFFILAIHFTLRVLKKNNFSGKLVLLSSLCLFVTGLLKYLFIPVVFIIPVFLLLKGVSDKNKEIKRSGVLSFILLLISLGGILAWQKISSGSATYISETTRGFFPENLSGIHPAIPASFISPETADLVLPASTHIIFFRILQGLHILLFLAAFIYILKRIIKNGFKKLDITGSFFYLAFFLSAGISLVLLILSLYVGKEENIPGHLWTYVEEARYYGLINVLIHLGVFVLYQYYRSGKTRSLKYVFIVLLLLSLPEIFRGVLFTAKRVINVKQEEYSWQHEHEIQEYAAMVIRNEKLPGENVVVTGSSYYINYRVALYSHIPILLDAASVNDPKKLNTKKQTLLLVILPEDAIENDALEVQRENELAGYVRGFYFYTLHVKPH